MSTRNVVAIGPVGGGKSWFLNQLFGNKVFAEATSYASCTSRVDMQSKAIRDNINNAEYQLNLFDTPGLGSTFEQRAANADNIIGLIASNQFNQIVLVCKVGLPLSQDFEMYLQILNFFLKNLILKSPGSFTLVLNQISTRTTDLELIEYFKRVQSLIQFQIKDCICIRYGAVSRDSVFDFLLEGENDSYEFQQSNFLSIVSRSDALIDPSLETPSRAFTRALHQAPTKEKIYEMEHKIERNRERITSGKFHLRIIYSIAMFLAFVGALFLILVVLTIMPKILGISLFGGLFLVAILMTVFGILGRDPGIIQRECETRDLERRLLRIKSSDQRQIGNQKLREFAQFLNFNPQTSQQ